MVTVLEHAYVPPTPTERRRRQRNVLIAFNLGFVAYNAWAVMAQVFFGRPFDWFLEAVLFLIFGVVDYLFVRSGEGHIAA